MPKGRPGGNPDLKKYQFQQKYDWDEPCTERMQISRDAVAGDGDRVVRMGSLDDPIESQFCAFSDGIAHHYGGALLGIKSNNR